MDFEIIKKISTAQHGVVARYQLLDSGLSNNVVRRLLRHPSLMKVALGVYTTVGSQNTWHQQAAIATLSCGRHSALSHESVLVLFGFLRTDWQPYRNRHHHLYQVDNIHVVSNRTIRYETATSSHRSHSISKRKSFPVKSGIRHIELERAIIDCAQKLTLHELDYVVEKALQQRLISAQSLQKSLDELHTAPGREKKRLQELLVHYLGSEDAGITESVLEKRVQIILKKDLMCEYTTQHEVILSGNKYRLDFAIPSHKIAIEVDGFSFHRTRTQFDDDRMRQNALVANNWKMVRVTSAFTNDQMRQAISNALHS